MTSFLFPRWLFPFIIFHRNAQPFLRYSLVVPYFWLWFSKTFGLVLHHDRKTHIEFQFTRLKVKVIMTQKQTITCISSVIAMNLFNIKTSYFILQQKMKSGNYMSNFVSKGQRSTFRRLSGCTYILTGYLNTSWSVLLRCTQIQDDERNMPSKF